MTTFVARLRNFLGAFALLALAAMAQQAVAQQPTSVNPTASAVKEEQLLRQQDKITGRVSIPDERSGVLEQPTGLGWRYFHDVTLRWIGGIAILGVLALTVIFYLWRGTVRISAGRSGRKVVRFGPFERFVHWVTATTFILLGLTGLNITFGKALLLPLMSHEAFSAWSEIAKYIHNYSSFAFSLGIVGIFLMWIGGNIPNRIDVEWFKRGGGMVGKDHPPAQFFNGGQKAVYWIVVLAGTAVAVTGYLLMFPFYGTDIFAMQVSQIVHAVVSVLFIAVIVAHIYIGTLGMQGAFEAMGSGKVDVNWAKEHHSLWAEGKDAREGGGAPQGHPAPAE